MKRYNRRLRDLIHDDRAAPSFIVSHELPLDQAPDAYPVTASGGAGVDAHIIGRSAYVGQRKVV